MRMPTIFLAHGTPYLLDDAPWVEQLRRWAHALPRPRAILVLSAHWVDAPVTLGATQPAPLIHDFTGYPASYYAVTYPAPGAPRLAHRIRILLGLDKVRDDPERGLDHGAYVPLLAMYPRADVPVLQMSLPTLDPKPLLALGRALAPLRDEGVLLVASGFLTHNLRTIAFDPPPTTPRWAFEFDHWIADVLQRGDIEALLDYKRRAPFVGVALPTHEHFVPVIVTAGASIGSPDRVTFPITGFTYGSFSKRSVQFG